MYIPLIKKTVYCICWQQYYYWLFSSVVVTSIHIIS